MLIFQFDLCINVTVDVKSRGVRATGKENIITGIVLWEVYCTKAIVEFNNNPLSTNIIENHLDSLRFP